MEALLTRIKELADTDVTLKGTFTGGAFHGWRPRPTDQNKIDPYFCYTVNVGASGAENTCSSRLDPIRVRFQCWADTDIEVIRGVALLRKTYKNIGALPGGVDKVRRVTELTQGVFEEPKPAPNAIPVWQGFIELSFEVLTDPEA